MSECSNCGKWRQLADYPTMGDCLASGGSTTAGYVCNRHEPASVAVAKAQRKPREIDIAAAADDVIACSLPRVDIVAVERLLRCTYSQAAEIIELLKSQGRIK
jgi:hypothetical protein